ncbi:MAG: hypothetical protein ACWGNV_02425, partial [Bacteroidales bacterium]
MGVPHIGIILQRVQEPSAFPVTSAAVSAITRLWMLSWLQFEKPSEDAMNSYRFIGKQTHRKDAAD